MRRSTDSSGGITSGAGTSGGGCAERTKKKRKRYGSYERRRRLAGKRPSSARSAIVARRERIGDWEIDTMVGTGSRHAVLVLTERKTGKVRLGKVPARTATAIRRRAIHLLRTERRWVWTITDDNGPEFHQYAGIEEADRCGGLLRPAVPGVGAGDLREHHWAGLPVPAERHEPCQRDSERLRRHRATAQPSAAEAAGPSNPGGVL